MANLADQIEQYIKSRLEASDDGFLEVKRNDIAMVFGCVPSQINYVLQTRFSEEQGYLVESRRGGGGYLRIVKLAFNSDEDLAHLLSEGIGQQIAQEGAERLVARLQEEGYLTPRESLLIRTAIRRDVLRGETGQRDALRARILKAVLYSVLREDL